MITQTKNKPVNRMGETNPRGTRKAAILVSALDHGMIDTLLDQMGPAQAGLVRQAVIELDDVDPDEQERIIEEFFKLGPGLPEKRPVGKRPADGQFEFLGEAQSEGLAEILKSERPQTIALVLSRMSPDRAGKVLVQFSPDMQAEVVRRLVDLEETDPDILHEIEGELQKRLSQKLHIQRRRVAGVSAVTGILEAANSEIGATILRNVAARDKRLAQRFAAGGSGFDASGSKDDYTAGRGRAVPDSVDEHFSRQPEPERVDFMDLAAMDADTLFAIIENVGREILVLALLGAPGHLINRVLRQMPHARATAIRHELANIGPVRLGDIEEARRRLVETVVQLHAQGRIRLSVTRGESLIGLTA